MTALQVAAIIAGVTIASFAVVIYLCAAAPVWDQEEEGSFYVKPLGGDHE